MKRLWLVGLMPIFMWLFAGPPAFLEPEEAFKAKLIQKDNTIYAEVLLGEGIYLYKDKTKLTSSAGTVLKYTLPQGEIHEGFEGPEAVFTHKLAFEAVISSSEAQAKAVDVTLAFQGCSSQGLCYQPMTITEKFSFNFATQSVSSSGSEEDLSEADKIKQIFSSNFVLILFTFFGLGVLLSLTPCVFPMIPILSSIIVSQGENLTTKRSFMLSVIYVLAMAVAYTLAGIASAYSGESIQAAFQIPWVIVAFSLVFVALSLSMFGFYDLEMPQWVQNRVTKISRDAEGKGVAGVAIMGFLSALIVGPCVAAPLAGVLAYIGQTGDAVLGGSALFMMSLGMGLPLLIIGLGAGRFMPKPGEWMDAVKAIFGVMMLGVAIWMLKRVLDEEIIMLLISFLFIMSSLYLGSMDSHYTDTIGWHRFSKGIGVLLFMYGVIMFVGSFTHGTINDPLKAFSANRAGLVSAKPQGLVFTEKVSSKDDLQKVLDKAGDKVVMLDFTASWCEQCRELEEDVFHNPKVVTMTKGFVLVEADISVDTQDTKALKKALEVQGPPAIRFFRNGKEISRASRMQGPNLETFLEKISKF